jgi:hypothetical protein
MGAAAFDAQDIGERVDAGAYPEGEVVPGSGGTAVDACFRCRRVPSGPRRLRIEDGCRFLSRSTRCVVANMVLLG